MSTTTTDLNAERAILYWAADRIDADYYDQEGDAIADMVRVWADQLDAAPATYALPAEPLPEVTELWDRHGCRWQRDQPGHWLLVEQTEAGEGRIWHLVIPCVMPWRSLLGEHGDLSTVPPEPAPAGGEDTP